jgi:hypothetical protein
VSVRDNKALLFTLLVAAAGLWALAQTAGWPVKAWLYPRVITVPLVVLALVETALVLRGRESAEAEPVPDIEMDTSVDPTLASRRTLNVILWIGGMFAAVLLVGFQAAVPAFVFAYLRIAGKERWVLSAALALIAVLVFHLLFVSLLHLPLPPGWLWRLLGR